MALERNHSAAAQEHLHADDVGLIGRALDQGDPRAQRDLILRFAPLMARQIGLRTWPPRTRPEQLELLQAMLVRLFCPGVDACRTPPALKKWRPELGALDNYVVGFARTRLRFPPRAPRPVGELSEEIACRDPSPHDRAVALSEAEHLLSQLSQTERQLFGALFIKQLDVADVCNELGISEALLYQRKRRLRLKIEELLATHQSRGDANAPPLRPPQVQRFTGGCRSR